MSNGMDQAIKDFAKQFSYQPQIEGDFQPKNIKRYVVAGMGGSHLAGDIIKTLRPELDIIIWPNYGLPPAVENDLAHTLLIASSYSGNTEEPIDTFKTAVARKMPMIAIAIGGQILALAQKHNVPYIQLPDTGIQPRSALGFSFLAMLKAMGQIELMNQASRLAHTLEPTDFEATGRALAEKFKGLVPVIYASARNFSVAYNWKIKLNETGKIPAFCNVFPELNHNEINSFDIKDSIRPLAEKFYFVFLKDSDDHPKISKRLEVTKKLYQDRGLPVEVVELSGDSALEKVFSSSLTADWLAFYTAEQYGLESEQVPMVEEFKKLIK